MRLQSARLYTRGPESVRIELREEPTRFMVVELGPGQKWAHQVFDCYSDALQFQDARERQLLSERFTLEVVEQFGTFGRTTSRLNGRKLKSVVPVDWERRTGDDRRRVDFADID